MHHHHYAPLPLWFGIVSILLVLVPLAIFAYLNWRLERTWQQRPPDEEEDA